MKSKLILAGVLLSAPAVAWAADQFTSPSGYQIQPAKGWRTDKSGIVNTDVALLAPTNNDFAANLTVKVLPIAENETLDADKGIGNDIFPRMFKDYHLVSQETKNLDGVPALWTVSTYHTVQPALSLRMRRVEAIKDGVVYYFTATELDTNKSKSDQAITDMLKSIKWTKPAATSDPNAVSI